MGAQVRKPFRQMLLAVLFLLAACVDPNARVAAHGTFSTSDFSVTWPDRWHAVQETESNLVLSDGITNVHIVGILDTQSPELSVPELVYDWFTFVIEGEDIVETEPVTSIGPDRAFSVYTYRYRVDSQRLDPYAVYFEVRRVTPGLLLWVVIDTHLGLYRSDPNVFGAMIASLQIDGEAATGPPAQSFASGPWQIAIPSVTIEHAIPWLGLSSIPGQNWVVVLVDIANAGDAGLPFPIESAGIETDDGSRFWPSSIDSYAVNSSLRLDAPIFSAAPLLPGSLNRLALVYQVPEEAVGLKFFVAEHGMAVDTLIDPAFGVATLPPRPRMPLLLSGVIAGWAENNVVQITMGDGSVREMALLGTRLPAQAGCFGQETSAYLQSLVGKTVTIEHDPAVISTGQAYLWIDDDSGAPALLNHELIALGFADVVAIPQDARFSMWLQQTAATAHQQRAGRWAVCQ